MSDKIKLAVIGSRSFEDRERLYKILDANIDRIEMIISGGAAGGDKLAQEWAQDRGVPALIFYPRWYTLDGEYDRGAGFKRNYLIIKACDKVLAFWDNESRGTKNSIDIAKELGVPVVIKTFVPTPKVKTEKKQEGDLE